MRLAGHRSRPRSTFRKRIERVRQKLIDAGVAVDQLDRVRSPIGLDINAETPQQIAVSILAEITALA